jgi:hypothetical protein
MDYTKTYYELKSLFTFSQKEISVPGSGIKIHNIGFRSDTSVNQFINENDSLIFENNSFIYPVFAPERKESNKVILLLHGLNERSWVKYLVWAYWLAKYTESYIILFPISFHINRSPAVWKDPRAMIPLMKVRNSEPVEINMSSFANVALSNRLTEDPMRFFNSGYQTAADIIKLFLAIRDGEHPIIPRTSNINIFAYSIGAFLGEIILMGNPENLFSKSKLFIFCGGSVFSNMRGSSKLIMDSLAFEKVYNFYLDDFEKKITGKSALSDLLKFSQIGMAFRSMIDLGRLKNFRENVLRKLNGQIHAIALLKDKVIPASGAVETHRIWKKEIFNHVKVWDFPYLYSHENPFPVFDTPLNQQVDRCFDKVFNEALAFFS